MKILGFDTAAPTNTIGLVDDGRLLAEHAWEARDNSLQRIVLNIDLVLKRAGVAPGDVDGLAVGIGPGSWTGGKVGVTVGKTLAYAMDRPICGVTSFEALAYQSRGSTLQLCPLVAAGRDTIYAAFFRAGAGALVRAGDYYVGAIEGLAALVREPTLFLGKPAHVHRQALAGALGPLAAFGSPSDSPAGSAFAWLALPRLRQGAGDDPLSLAPLYLTEYLAQALLKRRPDRETRG